MITADEARWFAQASYAPITSDDIWAAIKAAAQLGHFETTVKHNRRQEWPNSLTSQLKDAGFHITRVYREPYMFTTITWHRH